LPVVTIISEQSIFNEARLKSVFQRETCPETWQGEYRPPCKNSIGDQKATFTRMLDFVGRHEEKY